MTNRQKKPLELYIHIPFCARKCLYCDFLSFRTLAAVHEEYVKQLIKEIEAEGATCHEYQVVTVFIGGGTPSVLEPELIRDICQAVQRSFELAPDAEFTAEVNPGTLLQNKLHIYRASGINRISMGLQSADNRELEYLGRIHSFEEFLKSFQCARMAGFSNINVDLMSGIPGQTLESWKNTLKKVTMLKPEHISAYSLIIEEGTPFWDRYGAEGQATGEPGTPPTPEGQAMPEGRRTPEGQAMPEGRRTPEGQAQGRPVRQCPSSERMALRRRDYPPLPDEDTENRIYHLTRSFLADQGYERYEISNYARPGFECRHNIGYWTEVEYLGLGLGSSSYMAGCRFCNERDLETYLNLDLSAEGWSGRLHPQLQQLSREARMEEFMFLGLRMICGISEINFVSTFGVKLESVYGPVIKHLIENGLMRRDGVWLSLTEWGMDVSNYVLSEFLLG